MLNKIISSAIKISGAVLLSQLMGCVDLPDPSVDRKVYDDIADTDKDGVINQRDYCARTPFGSEIDNDGCSIWSSKFQKETFTIHFDYDQSAIRSDQQDTLQHLVKVLNQYPEVRVELVGDTSPEGTVEYNTALAKRRTNALAAALIKQGVDDNRIDRHIYTETIKEVADELKNQRERRTKAILYHPGSSTANRAWSIYSAEKKIQRPQ